MVVCIASIILLSCTLASVSASIHESVEVGESGVTVTVTVINDDDMSSFRPKLMQAGGEFEWEVNKMVWDPVTNTWVDEITAQVGDIVTFQINLICKNISGIGLILGEDIFPNNFRYVDGNGTVNSSENTLYVNLTLLLEIEGCSNGVNEMKFAVYGINQSTGEKILVDEISDTATVRGVECPVPAFTPVGLIALVSALSAIAAVTIVRKRR